MTILQTIPVNPVAFPYDLKENLTWPYVRVTGGTPVSVRAFILVGDSGNE